MATEACALITSAGILFLLTQVQVVAAMRQYGMARLMGNRDDLPPAAPLLARAGRAVGNHVEGLGAVGLVVLAVGLR